MAVVYHAQNTMQSHLKASSKNDTLPGSFLIHPPLTPPETGAELSERVTKIHHLLVERKSGRGLSDPPWQTFKLHLDECTELLDLFRSEKSLWGFVEDKVRYISALNGKLGEANLLTAADMTTVLSSKFSPLEYPQRLHDTFIRRVVEEIKRQLNTISTLEPQLRSYIESINEVAGRVEFPITAEDGHQAFIWREPDAMFSHDDARWPGVVIEVSYSQKRKNLRDLADDYILESNGGIKLVVGLDLEYHGSQKATISTWQLRRTIDEQGEEQYTASPIVEDQVRIRINSLHRVRISKVTSHTNQRDTYRSSEMTMATLTQLPAPVYESSLRILHVTTFPMTSKDLWRSIPRLCAACSSRQRRDMACGSGWKVLARRLYR